MRDLIGLILSDPTPTPPPHPQPALLKTNPPSPLDTNWRCDTCLFASLQFLARQMIPIVSDTRSLLLCSLLYRWRLSGVINFLWLKLRRLLTTASVTPYRPDCRIYFSPEILYILCKWLAPQALLKKTFIEKSRKNSKQRPSKGTYPGSIERKKNPYQFFTLCN